MSFGLNIYSSSGNLTASTDLSAKGLLYGGNVSVSSNTTIPRYGLDDVIYTSTRTGLLQFSSFVQSTGYWIMSMTTGGKVTAYGAYIPPTTYKTSTGYVTGSGGYQHVNWYAGASNSELIIINNQSVSCSVFGSLLPSSENTFGLQCNNPSNNAVVFSNNYKTLAHITGVLSATSVNLPNYLVKALPPTSGTQSLTTGATMNITFPYPLDYPPLVFITHSDGPISLAHMFTDGNGKYIGACICSPQSQGSWTSSGGTSYLGWVNPSSYNFSYFLAYGTANTSVGSGFGLEIRDQSNNVVMSTNRSLGEFNSFNHNTPYTFVQHNGTTTKTILHSNDSSSNWGSIYPDNIDRAFCLNEFRAIEGLCRCVGEASFTTSNTGFLVASMMFHGNYLTVNKYSKVVTTMSRGTCTYGALFFSPFTGFGYQYFPSHEFSDLSIFNTVKLFSTTY
jgi:hypothetical protein